MRHTPPITTLFPYTTLFRSLTGAAFGTVMLANVWRVIWPNQKIVIANAVAIAGGGQANPAAAGAARRAFLAMRSEEHTSELQSQFHLVCRLLLEKKKLNFS